MQLKFDIPATILLCRYILNLVYAGKKCYIERRPKTPPPWQFGSKPNREQKPGKRNFSDEVQTKILQSFKWQIVGQLHITMD